MKRTRNHHKPVGTQRTQPFVEAFGCENLSWNQIPVAASFAKATTFLDYVEIKGKQRIEAQLAQPVHVCIHFVGESGRPFEEKLHIGVDRSLPLSNSRAVFVFVSLPAIPFRGAHSFTASGFLNDANRMEGSLWADSYGRTESGCEQRMGNLYGKYMKRAT